MPFAPRGRSSVATAAEACVVSVGNSRRGTEVHVVRPAGVSVRSPGIVEPAAQKIRPDHPVLGCTRWLVCRLRELPLVTKVLCAEGQGDPLAVIRLLSRLTAPRDPLLTFPHASRSFDACGVRVAHLQQLVHAECAQQASTAWIALRATLNDRRLLLIASILPCVSWPGLQNRKATHLRAEPTAQGKGTQHDTIFTICDGGVYRYLRADIYRRRRCNGSRSRAHSRGRPGSRHDHYDLCDGFRRC